jgi:hypothetical protein
MRLRAVSLRYNFVELFLRELGDKLGISECLVVPAVLEHGGRVCQELTIVLLL